MIEAVKVSVDDETQAIIEQLVDQISDAIAGEADQQHQDIEKFHEALEALKQELGSASFAEKLSSIQQKVSELSVAASDTGKWSSLQDKLIREINALGGRSKVYLDQLISQQQESSAALMQAVQKLQRTLRTQNKIIGRQGQQLADIMKKLDRQQAIVEEHQAALGRLARGAIPDSPKQVRHDGFPVNDVTFFFIYGA